MVRFSWKAGRRRRGGGEYYALLPNICTGHHRGYVARASACLPSRDAKELLFKDGIIRVAALSSPAGGNWPWP